MPPDAPVVVCSSVDAALRQLDARRDIERIFVIGGAAVFAAALGLARCRTIHMTLVRPPTSVPYDAFFPQLDPRDWAADGEPRASQGGWQATPDGVRFAFTTLRRIVRSAAAAADNADNAVS